MDRANSLGMSLKLVFCGTPEFAVPTLRAVLGAGHEVALVVTQPDRAAGRGMEMQAPAVKRLAIQQGLPLVQPERIKNNAELREKLETIRPDAIVVVAYGRIIPEWMLSLPPLGNINLHGSLLPKYRGAAPVQWAMANGEPVTGVTTMKLDTGLDTGDMLLARAVPIGGEMSSAEVFDVLAAVGADLMVETLAGLDSGKIVPVAQRHDLATLAPVLKREDGLVDFGRRARAIYDRWRGFYPWPGAYTVFRGKKLILHGVREVSFESIGEGAESTSEGELVVAGDSLTVVCGGLTALLMEELQLEGKRRMTAAEFGRGYQVKTGERLGL